MGQEGQEVAVQIGDLGGRGQGGSLQTKGKELRGGEHTHASLRSFCLLDCRRVSASSKTHPGPGKGPQTWQEEVTDSCFMWLIQRKSKLWAGNLYEYFLLLQIKKIYNSLPK